MNLRHQKLPPPRCGAAADAEPACRKKAGVDTLVGLIAANEEAQRFYHALPRAQVRDEGIWIDIG